MNEGGNIRQARRLAMMTATLLSVFLGLYYLTSDQGYDFTGHIIGRDFANIHLGGQLVGQGQADVLFEPDRYEAAMRQWLGDDYSAHNWSYPPSLFAFAELLAQIPYFWSLLLWVGGGVLALALAARQAGLSPIWIALIVLSPAGAWNLVAGQNGFFLAAFIVFAVQAGHRGATVPSSVSWALATIKPHLGLLALPMVLGQRRYAVLVGTALGVCVLVGLSVLLYGADPWVKFFEVTSAQQRDVAETWRGQLLYTMPTAFMQGRLLDLPLAWSYGLQGFVAVLGVWLLWRAWPGQGGTSRDWLTWLVIGTFVMLPYSFVYDMVLLQFALALWGRDPESLLRMQDKNKAMFVWGLVWMSPLILVFVAVFTKIQFGPILLLWLLWRLGEARPDSTAPLEQQG